MAELVVNFLGQSVQINSASPQTWDYPFLTYGIANSELDDLFTGSSVTYSTLNAYGTPNRPNMSGVQFVDIQALFYAAYGKYSTTNPPVWNIPSVTTFAQFCAMPNARITISSGGYIIAILGSQVLNGSRFVFSTPAATPNNTPPTGSVSFGIAKLSSGYRFAIGQLANDDVNSVMTVFLADDGAQINFTQATSLPQWAPNGFNVFVGSAPATSPSYPSNQNTSHSVSAGTEIRFAIDQNDLLAGARLYYNVSNSSIPAVPTVTSHSGIFNFPSSQFVDGGANYEPFSPNNVPPINNRVILATAGEDYYFTVKAIGPGALDSNPQYFIFTT